jgi:ribosomal protein S12 methylthiotransferase accessory factor
MQFISYPAPIWQTVARLARGASRPDGAESGAAVELLVMLAVPEGPAEARAGAFKTLAAYLDLAAAASDVFQIVAPDAPGLIFVAAMSQPSRHLPRWSADERVSAGGCGETFQHAFLACMGELAERLLLHADQPLLAETEPGMAQAGAAAEDLLALANFDGPEASPAEWLAARDLANGAASAVPASLCRVGSTSSPSPINPGVGCASGATAEQAVLSGLLEWVERDACAHWWFGVREPRHIALETLDEAGLPDLVRTLRGGRSERSSWFLDITSEWDIPCVVAVSFDADGKGFVHGAAARPSLGAAARAAYLEMCQMEVARHLIATKIDAGGRDSLSPADRRHLVRFEAVVADDWPIVRPNGAPARRPVPEQPIDLDLMVGRLSAGGLTCLAVDLSVAELGIPVVKTIVTGLQPLPASVRTQRFRRALKAAGSPASEPVDLF